MRNVEFFKSVPFPLRIQTIEPRKLIVQSNEPFFDSPDYKNANDELWKSIGCDGWFRGAHGYSVYCRKIPSAPNYILIIHGLKISGEWKSRGRDGNFSIVSPRERIVSYVDSLFKSYAEINKKASEEIDTKVKTLVTDSIHEIRSMNTSIYHAAYELQNELLYESSLKLALSKNIVALSELMSSRIQLADLVANESTALLDKESTPVAVYKKFEKITKCYIAYAKRRDISINFSGNSKSSIRGVSNFEMIPLIVIDNAVKYSPSKRNVDIDVQENSTNIICKVTSLGPKIEPYEKELIFDREFRGTHAMSSGQSGSGIGLSFLKRLLSSVDGKISVEQDSEPMRFNGKSFYQTVFTLEFPLQ